MTKFRILTAFLAAAVLVQVLFCSPVQAAAVINVNLYAKTDTVKAGDTISLSVSFDKFPNLTRFGPIEVQFDPTYVSFEGMDKGSAMPSTFSVSNTTSTSVIAIVGVDQTTEGIIASNQTAPATDLAGNPVPTPADPSMFSDSSVTICVLHFKVIDTAPSGETNFWLGGIGGFKDSSLSQLPASAGNTVIIPVQSLLSSQASLSSLSVEDAELSPVFSPSVFKYQTHVSRSITEVNITAAALDTTAKVMITGNDNLAVGDNPATIRVVAQDGKTALEYEINIIRDSSFVPAGASITGTDGKLYSFSEIPDTLTLPSGFSQTTVMLGTQSVPAFIGNGYKSMLLFLKDGETDPALYLYNPETGSIRLYDEDLILSVQAQILTITDIPSPDIIPKGFYQADITVGGKTAQGCISEKSDITLVYLSDEAGNSRFYEIDPVTGNIYPYKDVKETNTTSFLIPFVIAAVLAAAEFGMIFYIIYQVRSRNRPQEVKRV